MKSFLEKYKVDALVFGGVFNSKRSELSVCTKNLCYEACFDELGGSSDALRSN